jgi:hypothetical protein
MRTPIAPKAVAVLLFLGWFLGRSQLKLVVMCKGFSSRELLGRFNVAKQMSRSLMTSGFSVLELKERDLSKNCFRFLEKVV